MRTIFDGPGYFSDFMPLRMVWLSGLWRMIGGGDQVAANICLVMVADIFSEEERYRTLKTVIFSFGLNSHADQTLSSDCNPACSLQRSWPLRSAPI